MAQNETKRHFELRDLKGDFEKAQQEAYKVVSQEDVKRKAREFQLLIAALVGMAVLLIWLFGGF